MLTRLYNLATNYVTDPRRTTEGHFKHFHADIVIIVCFAVVCGRYTYRGYWLWAVTHQSFLKTFLKLSNGIPGVDTIRRFLEAAIPEQINYCLSTALGLFRSYIFGDFLHLDGKAIRGSGNTNHRPYQVVSIYSQEKQAAIEQMVVDEKTNEIKAVTPILERLEIEGCDITGDAIYCQKAIVAYIVGRKAGYNIALKENQRSLYEAIYLFYSNMPDEDLNWYIVGPEKNHGRLETRYHCILSDLDWLPCRKEWANLQGIGVVKASVTDLKTGETSESIRFYILSHTDVQKFATQTRGHWMIENDLHYRLDVFMKEDACRARKGNSPINLNLFRKFALVFLKNTKKLITCLGRLSTPDIQALLNESTNILRNATLGREINSV